MGQLSDRIFLGRRVTGLTIGQVVSEAAARWGAKTYLHDLATERRYSYADLDRISAAWAQGLQAAGIGKGCHVALMLYNSADMLFLYYALARAGAVVAPLNPEARGELLAYYLYLCDATVLIAEAAVLEEVDGVAGRPGSRITTLICRGEMQKIAQRPGRRVLAF
jgi:acyl-CoA synthetase (AMP-forming)/AMP-acid ligase II